MSGYSLQILPLIVKLVHYVHLVQYCSSISTFIIGLRKLLHCDFNSLKLHLAAGNFQIPLLI